MKIIRKIIVFDNYFYEFIKSINQKVIKKIAHVLFLVSYIERVPIKFFKHIESTDGLYEIRVEYEGNIYRIFCCFDEGKLVVLFNGFHKKTQKIPQNEIEKAIRIKELYFKNKKDEDKQTAYYDI